MQILFRQKGVEVMQVSGGALRFFVCQIEIGICKMVYLYLDFSENDKPPPYPLLLSPLLLVSKQENANILPLVHAGVVLSQTSA